MRAEVLEGLLAAHLVAALEDANVVSAVQASLSTGKRVQLENRSFGPRVVSEPR
jgi:hypothetical protein